MTSPRLESRLASNSPAVISIFRIIVGLLFAVHGSATILGWPFGAAIPFGMTAGWWSGIIQLVAGLLVAIGLFTRPAAFIASGEMAVAYFWKHVIDPPPGITKSFWPHVNNGELAVLFCFAFLLLVFIGPGSIAVDTMRRRRGPATGYAARRERPNLMSRFRR
jgi:putative oxidoreductase